MKHKATCQMTHFKAAAGSLRGGTAPARGIANTSRFRCNKKSGWQGDHIFCCDLCTDAQRFITCQRLEICDLPGGARRKEPLKKAISATGSG